MSKTAIKPKNQFSFEKGETVDTGEGLTEQAHKKECDMNYILADYRRTGLIKHAAKFKGKYDDVTQADFQDAMFIVTEAQQMFEQLPSETRNRFGNDPGAFLGFVQNPDNKEEMQKMGILKGNDGIDINGAVVPSPVETQPVVEPPPTE
jgi:phage internal scaffolding protein